MNLFNPPFSFRFFTAFLVLSLMTAWALAQTAGPEFQVNSYTTLDQEKPSVGLDSSGSFVVVWMSEGADDSLSSTILGQRYHADGATVGLEFRINPSTLSNAFFPAVSVASDGSFVVAWTGPGIYGSIVSARRYSPEGIPEAVQLPAGTAGNVIQPDVAMIDDGRFIVAWEDVFGDSHGTSIAVRLYGSDGSAVGSPFQVNSYTTGNQRLPSVDVFETGEFLVVWQSEGAIDAVGQTILGQRFFSNGSTNGDEFRISSGTTSDHQTPAVATVPGGDFVVVWLSPGFYGGSIVATRRYASDGTPGPIVLPSGTVGALEFPEVAAAADGRYLVSWTNTAGSSGGDSDSSAIEGRFYGSDDSAIGALFQVNSYTTSVQGYPSVGASGSGDFVVVWESFGPDGDAYSVQGRRYTSTIFRDGFESGTTLAWSATSP